MSKVRKSLRYLKTFFNTRTPRQRDMDIRKQAVSTFKPDSILGQKLWLKNPNRYDLIGIDTRSVGWKKKRKTKPKSKAKPKVRRKLRPKTTIKKKKTSRKPTLIIKKKPIKKQPVKKLKLRQPKTGLNLISRRRRGQLSMKPRDIYEKQMVKRISHKSGMTYLQSMNLVKKARESDVDIEHKVDWKLSKNRSEQYELGLKALNLEISPLKRSMRSLSAEYSMYGF